MATSGKSPRAETIKLDLSKHNDFHNYAGSILPILQKFHPKDLDINTGAQLKSAWNFVQEFTVNAYHNLVIAGNFDNTISVDTAPNTLMKLHGLSYKINYINAGSYLPHQIALNAVRYLDVSVQRNGGLQQLILDNYNDIKSLKLGDGNFWQQLHKEQSFSSIVINNSDKNVIEHIVRNMILTPTQIEKISVWQGDEHEGNFKHKFGFAAAQAVVNYWEQLPEMAAALKQYDINTDLAQYWNYHYVATKEQKILSEAYSAKYAAGGVKFFGTTVSDYYHKCLGISKSDQSKLKLNEEIEKFNNRVELHISIADKYANIMTTYEEVQKARLMSANTIRNTDQENQ